MRWLAYVRRWKMPGNKKGFEIILLALCLVCGLIIGADHLGLFASGSLGIAFFAICSSISFMHSSYNIGSKNVSLVLGVVCIYGSGGFSESIDRGFVIMGWASVLLAMLLGKVAYWLKR